jgi:hypothetical protein
VKEGKPYSVRYDHINAMFLNEGALQNGRARSHGRVPAKAN